MGFSLQNYRGKAKKRARKVALVWLELSPDLNMKYCDVAALVVKKDEKAVLEGIDLTNDESAKSFLISWAQRHGMH
jgi:hypothetical protein